MNTICLFTAFIFFKHLFIFACTGSSLLHGLFSGCREQGLLVCGVFGLLTSVASPVVEHLV